MKSMWSRGKCRVRLVCLRQILFGRNEMGWDDESSEVTRADTCVTMSELS